MIYGQSAMALEKLKFIADFNLPTGEKYKDTEIGGLSGLVFDKKNNRLLSVSDDRGSVNDFRFYEFEFSLDDKSFSVKPSNVVFLKDTDGKAFKKDFLDCEGIALVNDDVVISTEGWINHNPIINPQILVLGRDGKQKSHLDVPEKFLPQKEMESKYGVRDNLVFEGLSLTQDQSVLYVGTEEALFQDDRTTTPTYESTVRIIQYKDQKVSKEFAYTLDKVPSIKVAGLTVGETGLSDLLAIDDKTFYAIERSYLPLAKKTIVRLFKASIKDDTTDISGFENIKDFVKKGKVKVIKKELLANLDDFLPLMNKDFQSIDNIEGITLGPKLTNGHDTLLLVSDNNFNKKQRTQFLAFEIIP